MGQHQELCDELDVGHAPLALLEIELSRSAAQQVGPHLGPHIPYLGLQRDQFPWLAQHRSANVMRNNFV